MEWGRVLRQYLFERGGYYECRRCGRSLERATDECPLCETESVATYEFD